MNNKTTVALVVNKAIEQGMNLKQILAFLEANRINVATFTVLEEIRLNMEARSTQHV